MSTLVGDPLEEPMPLGAATVYLNNIVMFDAVVSESGDWGDFWCSRGEGKKKEVTSQEAACYKSLLS
jgi:hypothetical protein